MKESATFKLLLENPDKYYKIPRLEKFSDSWSCRDSYCWVVGREDIDMRGCKLDKNGEPIVDENGYAI